MHEVTQLDNGLRVVTATMPHMNSVSLGLWVGTGGRYEAPELNGAAHFIEHMLFKGTKQRNAREISQAVEGVGGYLNAFTGEESTCFYAKAGSDRFDTLLDVLADMFLESKFDPVELNKERNVIKEEVAMYLDQPQQQVQELLNETLWPDQALGRPLTGTLQTLDGLTRDRLRAFQRQHYVTHSTVIAAAGNITHEQVVKAVKKLVKRFPNGKRPTYTPVINEQTKPRVRLFTKETEQTQLALAFRSCSRHDEQRFALRLLNTILGENMSSRLFQVVREDQGLAYSIYSSQSYFDDTGAFTISAGLDTGKVNKALKIILKELKQISETKVPAVELRRARDYVIGQMDLSLEGTENQMTWVGEQLLGYDRIMPVTEAKQRLTAVTATDIRRVAKSFFQPERLNLALVSPLKEARSLERLCRM